MKTAADPAFRQPPFLQDNCDLVRSDHGRCPRILPSYRCEPRRLVGDKLRDRGVALLDVEDPDVFRVTAGMDSLLVLVLEVETELRGTPDRLSGLDSVPVPILRNVFSLLFSPIVDVLVGLSTV